LHQPLFYRLIECFGEASGTPVVINTSFNIRGEPVVCAPDDAIKCFMGTDIDFLAIGPFLVSKV
jgi:carbamoyltransferase